VCVYVCVKENEREANQAMSLKNVRVGKAGINKAPLRILSSVIRLRLRSSKANWKRKENQIFGIYSVKK